MLRGGSRIATAASRAANKRAATVGVTGSRLVHGGLGLGNASGLRQGARAGTALRARLSTSKYKEAAETAADAQEGAAWKKRIFMHIGIIVGGSTLALGTALYLLSNTLKDHPVYAMAELIWRRDVDLASIVGQDIKLADLPKGLISGQVKQTEGLVSASVPVTGSEGACTIHYQVRAKTLTSV